MNEFAESVGVLYPVIFVALTVLWYITLSQISIWLKEKKRPEHFPITLVSLLVFVVITRGIGTESTIKVIAAAAIYWFMTHSEGRLGSLTPQLRLKFCSVGSVMASGACAAIATIIAMYVYTPLLFEGSSALSLLNAGVGLLIMAAFGTVMGQLRKVIRKRWPEAIQMSGYLRTGGMVIADWFFIDDVIMPAILGPALFSGLTVVSYVGASLASLSFMVLPVMYVVALPVYALWAWFHSGLLGWFGVISIKQHMLYEAYEALLWDDHVQRWLGGVTITANPGENRYIVSGILPQRTTLTSIRLRLEDIRNAQVDTSGVVIDSTMEPDYQRLSAILRRTSLRARRKSKSA